MQHKNISQPASTRYSIKYRVTLEATKPDGKKVEITDAEKETRKAALIFSRHFEIDTSETDKVIAFLNMVLATSAQVENFDIDTLYRHNYLNFVDGKDEQEKMSAAIQESLRINWAWKERHDHIIAAILGNAKKNDIKYSRYFKKCDLSDKPYIGLILNEVIKEFALIDTDFNFKVSSAENSGRLYVTNYATKLRAQQKLNKPLTKLHENTANFIYEECSFVLCLRLSGQYNAIYYLGNKLNEPTAFLANCQIAENSEFFKILKTKIVDILLKGPSPATAQEDAEKEAKEILKMINNNPLDPIACRHCEYINGYRLNATGEGSAALISKVGMLNAHNTDLAHNLSSPEMQSDKRRLSPPGKVAQMSSGQRNLAAQNRIQSPPGSPKNKISSPPLGASPPNTAREVAEGIGSAIVESNTLSLAEKERLLSSLLAQSIWAPSPLDLLNLTEGQKASTSKGGIRRRRSSSYSGTSATKAKDNAYIKDGSHSDEDHVFPKSEQQINDQSGGNNVEAKPIIADGRDSATNSQQIQPPPPAASISAGPGPS